MPASQPSQLLDFRGKAAVVTGAGKGIGAAIALRFAQAGAKLVVSYRSSEAGAGAVRNQVRSFGGEAVIVRGNVTQEDDVNLLVEETLRAYGQIDVWINNAGSYPASGILEMRPQEWHSVIADNLTAVHLCTRAAARQMQGQGTGGAIVNIASIEAENPAPGHSHYNAAKAGVLMYTRTAAQELGKYNIRVNAVSPGLIWREGLEKAWPEGVEAYLQAVPMGRLGQPEDVADCCLFLASPAARWITGANLVVDGGVLTCRAY
ncbi:MAG TPA: 3-oxoacyl-ACP reductase family protein [Terriglobales bacterium]|nr:3-oxoacyl-ACP reductase family protein [Terriglobales bacterium]